MQKMQMSLRAVFAAPVASVLIGLTACGVSSLHAGTGKGGVTESAEQTHREETVTWEQVQGLQKEQKYEAAYAAVEKIRLRANMAGSFKVGPATLQSMYTPEFTAY